ncbi:hypothetical protein Tco_0019460 [Tanacetum coccineum]
MAESQSQMAMPVIMEIGAKKWWKIGMGNHGDMGETRGNGNPYESAKRRRQPPPRGCVLAAAPPIREALLETAMGCDWVVFSLNKGAFGCETAMGCGWFMSFNKKGVFGCWHSSWGVGLVSAPTGYVSWGITARRVGFGGSRGTPWGAWFGCSQ